MLSGCAAAAQAEGPAPLSAALHWAGEAWRVRSGGGGAPGARPLGRVAAALVCLLGCHGRGAAALLPNPPPPQQSDAPGWRLARRCMPGAEAWRHLRRRARGLAAPAHTSAAGLDLQVPPRGPALQPSAASTSPHPAHSPPCDR